MTASTPITLEMIREAIRIQSRNKFKTYFPDTGPLRRELYGKHLAFFEAGKTHTERLAIAANRVGKSESIGAYEVTCHLTGIYPDWWPGRKFTRPTHWWAAGKTGETTRDIVQGKLLGKIERGAKEANTGETIGLGTGLIPGDLIINTSPKSGLPGAIDTAWIQHVSGGVSSLGLKSYGKERDSFEGTEKDGVWLDEEPPNDVKQECSIRLMSTRPGHQSGLLILTFTPLDGYTSVVNDFLESSDPDKWFIQIGWKDVPHLTPDIIAQMSKKFLPYELKARSEGIPSAGEGAIYPMDVEDLLVDDFAIPDYWPRAFGLDVGKTAVVWGAKNPDTDTLYLYREYFSEIYDVLIHAAAIKGPQDKDAWIQGVVDPASLGSSQIDGRNLFNIYTQDHKITLHTAENSVESGIYEVWTLMTTGRLKVFRSLKRWQNEFGRYHRKKTETALGEASKIVKKADHLMDAMRYLVVSGGRIMKTKPAGRELSRVPMPIDRPSRSVGWMR